MSKALDKSINISVLFPLFRLVLGQLPPEENFLPTPKLTLIQSLTLTRGHFSSGAIVWLPPPPRTLKLTLTLTETAPLSVGQFSSGGGGGGRGGSFRLLSQFPIIFSSACCALWFLRNRVYIFGKFITHYMYQFESK